MAKTGAAIGREIRAALSKVVGEAMLRAEEAVAAATPVDTHHAESNWVLSVGRPYAGVDGSRQAVSFEAQQAGIAAVQKYDVGSDGPIYLRNNVEYLRYLNDGWSPQAEAGFVERAIESAGDEVPRGRKTAVRKMLKGIARSSYNRGKK
jgi:hypothetical protein